MLLLALSLGDPAVAGEQFVALPKMAPVFDAAGQALDPLHVLLHELTFVRRESDGTHHFLLDWKTPVVAKGVNLFRPDSLIRITPGAHVTNLRRRWANRTLWCYGPHEAAQLSLDPANQSSTTVEGEQPLRIVRIYQLAGTPSVSAIPTIGMSSAWKCEDSWPGGPRLSPVTDPLLVVFAMPGARFNPPTWETWTGEEKRRAQDPRNYSPPFKFVMGSWLLDRMFSPKPPSAAMRRSIARHSNRSDDPYQPSPFSHREMAWVFGWPTVRKSKAALLKYQWWMYDDANFSYIFKNGRVVQFIKDPVPH